MFCHLIIMVSLLIQQIEHKMVFSSEIFFKGGFLSFSARIHVFINNTATLASPKFFRFHAAFVVDCLVVQFFFHSH